LVFLIIDDTRFEKSRQADKIAKIEGTRMSAFDFGIFSLLCGTNHGYFRFLSCRSHRLGIKRSLQ